MFADSPAHGTTGERLRRCISRLLPTAQHRAHLLPAAEPRLWRCPQGSSSLHSATPSRCKAAPSPPTGASSGAWGDATSPYGTAKSSSRSWFLLLPSVAEAAARKGAAPAAMPALGLEAASGGAVCRQEQAREGFEALGGASAATAPSLLLLVFRKPLPAHSSDRVTAHGE